MQDTSNSSSSYSASSSSGVPRGASEDDDYRLHCEEVIRRDPNHEEALLHLSLWHLERRNFSLARRYMQHLVTLQEGDFDTWLLLSLCCSMDDCIDDAITCNKIAEASTDSLTQTQKLKLHYMQIFILERNKEYDLALSQYSTLLQDLSEAIASNQKKLSDLTLSSSHPTPSSSSSAPDDNQDNGNEVEYEGLSGCELSEAVQNNLTCQLRIREEVRLRQAIIHKETGVTEEARVICDELLAENTSTECKVNVLCLRGMLYELKEDLISAEKVYLEAAQLEEYNPWASERLGRIYLKYGQTIPTALQFLFNSIKKNTVNSRTWYLLGRCYTATTKDNYAHEPCDYYSAYQAYYRAINLNPNDAKVWCSIGVLYYTFGQYKESLSHLTKAVKLDPTMPEAWYNIGALYEMCEQPEDAKQAYAKAKECGIRERFEQLGMKTNPPALDVEQLVDMAPSPSPSSDAIPKPSINMNTASAPKEQIMKSHSMDSLPTSESNFHPVHYQGSTPAPTVDDSATPRCTTPKRDAPQEGVQQQRVEQSYPSNCVDMDSKEEAYMQIAN